MFVCGYIVFVVGACGWLICLCCNMVVGWVCVLVCCMMGVEVVVMFEGGVFKCGLVCFIGVSLDG